MRSIILLFSLLLFIASCKKNTTENTCTVSNITAGYASPNNTLIPINTQNFWTYADSVYDQQTGQLVNAASSQINIENVYELRTLTYFDFTELLPPMTVIGDSLFAVTTTNNAQCYELTKKFFPVIDTTYMNSSGLQVLYKDKNTIHTLAGDFADNIVYLDGNSLRMYFHPGIGLVKVEFMLDKNIIKRTLTLKDYKVS